MATKWGKSTIAWKLIKVLIAFSSLITIVVSAVQLWLEYDRDISAINSGFQQIELSYLDSISENVWEADSGRLSLLVNGITEFPDFDFAAIRDESGQELIKVGQDDNGNAIRKTYALNYQFRGQGLVIGELEVVAGLSSVYSRTLDRVGIILLSNGIKTFFVAMFMFAVVYFLFTRRLEALTEFASGIDFDVPKKPLHLDRGILGGKRDEVDRLTDAINNMQERLFLSHEKTEEEVKKRTKSLSEEIVVRKKIESQRRKLSSAVEQSPNVIFITDIDGTIEYVNPKFTELMGYSSEEVLGNKPNMIKSGETPPEVYKDLWSTILSGNEWRGELKDRRKNGEVFWASALITPVRNEDGIVTNFVAMHEDITERKNAEKAMRDARHLAEVASKAKTDLLANMSHELRTPLNAIIGFSETMTSSIFGPLGNKQYEEYAEIIHTSGKHLLHIINDILDVSAVEAGKLELREELVNIADISESSIRILHPKTEEGHISLSGITTEDLPLLMADPIRLKQIFLNILSNAVKFTPENGTVSCDAHIDNEKNMIITVIDNGIGMDEEGLKKALGKFGQVDSSLTRAHDGSGLGLPLTKGLVELHGGTMEIESKLGEGTKVTICFPSERVISLEDESLQPLVDQ